MSQAEKHDFKWWALSVYAVLLTAILWAVFAMLLVPRTLICFANLLPKFDNTPKWVQRWARQQETFYDKYLKL